jgi:hypothetical protein
MRRFMVFLVGAFFLISMMPHISKAETPVVVELFTSQGCSSCPPADLLLQELANRDDIIALALHVDYWDYIGWTDTFGSPEHTKRQKTYAIALGERTIYTPQMIINGTRAVIGARPMQLWEEISAAKRQQNQVPVSMSRSGQMMQITAPPHALSEPVDVTLFQYHPSSAVQITRGENAGRTFTYTNVVRSIEILDTWSGQSPLDLSTPAQPDLPYVVILQAKESKAILGAARLH